jgi:hypothetical protein
MKIFSLPYAKYTLGKTPDSRAMKIHHKELRRQKAELILQLQKEKLLFFV